MEKMTVMLPDGCVAPGEFLWQPEDLQFMGSLERDKTCWAGLGWELWLLLAGPQAGDRRTDGRMDACHAPSSSCQRELEVRERFIRSQLLIPPDERLGVLDQAAEML